MAARTPAERQAAYRRRKANLTANLKALRKEVNRFDAAAPGPLRTDLTPWDSDTELVEKLTAWFQARADAAWKSKLET